MALLSPVAVSAMGTDAKPPRRLTAGPGDYRAMLTQLGPGDKMFLEPGHYREGLRLHGIVGTASQPVVIEGPAGPRQAIFVGRPGSHTVSFLDSAHVTVRKLVLDGRGAPVDAVRAEGHARWVHHVTLEDLTIVNHGASQQNSGISTKCPAWGWVIRRNTIVGAGTGMYFGDSDGSDPFFASLIESNRIVDPLGYGIQIKHQHGRPEGSPTGEISRTEVRDNLIVKGRVATAPELARPSLLVGHFPLAGPGVHDINVIHGNLLIDNPSEALFQGEGNIALYDNLMFNPRGEGVRIQPHNHRPREVAVFNNTIVAAALGLEFSGGEPGHPRLLEHNLVYGNPPMRSEVAGENITGPYDRARAAFVRLSTDPSTIDLTPRAVLPAPRTVIDDRWLALPGAKQDHVGRPRTARHFGACRRDGAAGSAFR
jgi:hypothetical protein